MHCVSEVLQYNNKTVDLVSPQKNRPHRISTVVSLKRKWPLNFLFLGTCVRWVGRSEDEHQRWGFLMFTTGGKLKVLSYCRSAEAQTSPSLAISADPSKRRLEIAFNL